MYMKKLTVFFIFVFALAANNLAFAQGKLVRNTGKALETTSKATAKQLPKLGVSAGTAAGLGNAATVSAAQTMHAVAQLQQTNLSAQAALQAPVPTSRMGKVKYAVQKIFTRSKRPSLPPQVLRPDLAFHITDFSALKTNAATVPPVTPWEKNPQDMFRAVSLPADGAALRNILENGFLLKDVGKFSNNRAMSYVSGDPRMVRQVSNIRFNSVAADPNAALHYAKQHHEKDIIVIARIQGLPEHGNIEHIQRDIPAENIVEVIAALHIKNIPVWCRVQPEADGFTITPYLFGNPQP